MQETVIIQRAPQPAPPEVIVHFKEKGLRVGPGKGEDKIYGSQIDPRDS